MTEANNSMAIGNNLKSVISNPLVTKFEWAWQ